MDKKRTVKHTLYFLLTTFFVVAATAFGDSRSNEREQSDPLSDQITEWQYEAARGEGLVDSTANFIIDSLGSLQPLMEKLLALRAGADSVVSILQIGDSHVQAGFWSDQIRTYLQREFGDAGRGLIVPYKMSGGNEPTNYAITSPHKVITSHAVSKTRGSEMGMSGVSVTFNDSEAEFQIWSKSPFNAITLFHSKGAPLMLVADRLMVDSYCTSDNQENSTRLVLKQMADTVKLRGRISLEYGDPTFYGFSLENGRAGVLYHAVGSNSAAFEHLASNTTLTEGGAKALNPSLIVVSLGTNNCYGGNYRSAHFKGVADRFVKRIKESYPDAAILITTPMESCRRTRRVYSPNPNVADVARILTEVALENGVAYWDMYSAAGGKGANGQWSNKGFYGRDRIHLTESGYRLQGDMMWQAVARYYNNYVTYGAGNPTHDEVR